MFPRDETAEDWTSAVSLSVVSTRPATRIYSQGILVFRQERVGFAFLTNRGQRAVAGNNHGFVRQGEDGVVQRMQDLRHRTARQIGASNGACEQCVSGNQLLVGSEVEADAALGVARRVQDAGGERSRGDGFSGGDA